MNGGREDAADVEEEYISEDSFYETGTRDDGFDEADFSVDDQPGWDSPWGFGRPGWHLECSAMSSKYLE